MGVRRERIEGCGWMDIGEMIRRAGIKKMAQGKVAVLNAAQARFTTLRLAEKRQGN